MTYKKYWNKKLFKIGQKKVKTKHLVGLAIAVILLIWFVPTQFAIIRDDISLSATLDEMKLSKDIRGVESPGAGVIFPKYVDFDKGTTWDLGGGTKHRLDPDHEKSGLPDLEMSLHEFSVSEKDKTKKYTHEGYEIKTTRHYVTIKIKFEVEGTESNNPLIRPYDETSRFRYEDMLLYVRLSSSGLMGITDGQIIAMDDGSEIDLDRTYCRAEDSISIDSLSGNPSDSLGNSARFKIHINEVWWNGGGRSFTANIKVKIPLVVATQKQISTTPGPTQPQVPTPTPPTIGGIGELSNLEIIRLLVLAGIGVLMLIILMMIFARLFRRR